MILHRKTIVISTLSVLSFLDRKSAVVNAFQFWVFRVDVHFKGALVLIPVLTDWTVKRNIRFQVVLDDMAPHATLESNEAIAS